MLCRRINVVAVAVLAAAALAALSPSARASTRVPMGFAGVELDGPATPFFPPAPGVDLGHELDVMVAAGVESIRITVNWGLMAPYQSWADVPADRRSRFTDADGIPLDLGTLDNLIALCAQRRLSVLPVVLNAPQWDARSDQGSIVAANTPRRFAPYATFMKALVDRYGPRGAFWRDHSPTWPVRTWQVWNEPNLVDKNDPSHGPYWAIQPNFESSYVGLLRAASSAIKAADPHARVVLAGMVGGSWYYVQQIYKVRGAAKLFDLVAIHPYTRYPQGVITVLGQVRHVMNRAGDSRKAILVDEVGWNSSLGKDPNHFGIETTEAGQASNVATLLRLIAQDWRPLGLAGFDYFNWAGVETPGDEFNYAGLSRFQDGRFVRKPAFAAFRSGVLALEHCRRKGSVATQCAKSG